MDLLRWAGRALCAGLLCLPTPSLAEDESAPTRLDPVEVIDTREEPEERLPTLDDEPTGFGTRLHRRDFLGERMEARDLLLHAPGTTVRQLPGGSTLALRGASPDQTLIFLDGIRLSSAAGGGVDLQSVPVAILDEVTVLRGNEGARYGSGALGGVALFRTPRSDRLARIRLTGGSFETYALDAAVGGRGRTFEGLAAVALERTEGDYPASFDPTPSASGSRLRVERVTNNDARAGSLLLKGGTRIEGARVQALALGSLSERGLPGTLYFRDTQRRAERRLLLSLSAEPEEPRDFSVRAGVSYRSEAHSVWGAEVPSVISQPVVPGEDRPWQHERAAEGRLALSWAPASFTLLGLSAGVGSEGIDSPYHGAPERLLLSVSAFDEIYVGALTLVLAGRYDRLGDHEGFSTRAGISYRAAEWLEFRANAAESFRAPSLGELYLVLGPVQPNPDLRPERGWMVDGGVVLGGRRAMAQLSVFHGLTEDMISYEIVSGGRSKPFNFLEAEVTGAEVEGAAQPLRWLSLRGGWGMAKTRNLLDDPRYLGKELPYRPTQRFFGRVSVHPDGWEGFVEAHHQTRQWVNRANTVSLPSQTWFRLGAGRRLTTLPWETWISAQADNLFDAYLVDQLGFPRPGRAFFVTLRANTSPSNGGST